MKSQIAREGETLEKQIREQQEQLQPQPDISLSFSDLPKQSKDESLKELLTMQAIKRPNQLLKSEGTALGESKALRIKEGAHTDFANP